MKCKIVIQTAESGMRRTSEVWSGELEIKDDTEYLVKVSLIGEGQPQPLCDIPFALGMGHYVWYPSDNAELERGDDGYSIGN